MIIYFLFFPRKLRTGRADPRACPSGIHSFSDVSTPLLAFFPPRVSGSRSLSSVVAGRSSRSIISLRRIVTTGFAAASACAAAISSGVTCTTPRPFELQMPRQDVQKRTSSPRRSLSAISGVMATLRTLVIKPGAPFPNPVLEGGRMYVWST
jgi:hypothetical protein